MSTNHKKMGNFGALNPAFRNIWCELKECQWELHQWGAGNRVELVPSTEGLHIWHRRAHSHDEFKVPTHSVHGVSPVWDQYGEHHPCEVCPARPGSQHSCVVCKTSTWYSWTYTLTQSLNVPPESRGHRVS